MATMMRCKLRWNGFPGSPGYSIFHIRNTEGGGFFTNVNAHDAIERVNTFATNIKALLPAGASLQSMADVEVIEETTGEMISVLSADNATIIASTGPSFVAYSAPAGAVITWRTGGVRNGRRIRGRTFIVPLHGNAYGTDGTLSTDTVTALTTAATAFASTTTTEDLGVYARPTREEVSPGVWETNPDGIWHAVTSFSIPDMAAVLRSRRS